MGLEVNVESRSRKILFAFPCENTFSAQYSKTLARVRHQAVWRNRIQALYLLSLQPSYNFLAFTSLFFWVLMALAMILFLACLAL